MSNVQNIYDNEVFFEGYRKLRDNKINYNNIQEKLAMQSLLPDMAGKTVLDLGCGFGENCVDFLNRGATRVVGVDISEKMLSIAKIDNAFENIEYIHLDMNDISTIEEKFDIVYSSLAFHYVKSFSKLLRDINYLLKDNGLLIYSQEHPLTTAPKQGPVWTLDENKKPLFYNLSDYMESGERSVKWFVEGVIKYHRPFSEIINTLIETGFKIEKMLEPLPDEEDLELIPNMKKDIHKPNFLLIKAVKMQ
ncbi:class I SAM-dependent methyltransferase [Clostridium estertheticum]|uniref:Methyltransferase domain-containing protein n=1 Tax=Clostridium estertheticum TaxID=238834 RepID=A0A7Y3SYV5_9CLOT|nr:class I SAM-dependent methyltransferase [Clostridium estertheticum]NNU76324.1 methyltransferase domain-containing protein [Clostridium estertheticum]WBL45819.1 methyltransferase domain-containing protein [Clostridium estertheticum]